MQSLYSAFRLSTRLSVRAWLSSSGKAVAADLLGQIYYNIFL